VHYGSVFQERTQLQLLYNIKFTNNIYNAKNQYLKYLAFVSKGCMIEHWMHCKIIYH
jgi:hypothetical protein